MSTDHSQGPAHAGPTTRQQKFHQLVADHGDRQAALIPFLQYCQELDGYVTAQAIADSARLSGLTPAEVTSVASFYSLLFLKPIGKHLIQVCRTLSCMLRGGDELRHHVRRRLGVAPNETTPDGRFTYQEVECLASCDQAPCLQHNLDYHYKVTPESFDALLETWRGQSPAATLPAE